MTDSLSLVSDLIRRARSAGADAADAVLVNGTSLSVASRQGKIEHLERSEGRDLGLRVFVGKRAAIVSSTSHDPAGFAKPVAPAFKLITKGAVGPSEAEAKQNPRARSAKLRAMEKMERLAA